MCFGNCWCRWIFGWFLASCPFDSIVDVGLLVYLFDRLVDYLSNVFYKLYIIGWLISIDWLVLIDWLTKYFFDW